MFDLENNLPILAGLNKVLKHQYMLFREHLDFITFLLLNYLFTLKKEFMTEDCKKYCEAT